MQQHHSKRLYIAIRRKLIGSQDLLQNVLLKSALQPATPGNTTLVLCRMQWVVVPVGRHVDTQLMQRIMHCLDDT